MERLYTNIVGTAVLVDDGIRPIAIVRDVVMDPDRGKMLALVVDANRNLIIAPMDILSWGDSIRVHSHDVIIDGHDVLRVEEVQRQHNDIYEKRVETEDGEVLGRVVDFSIDGQTYELQKLHVSKVVLGMVRYGGRIISAKKIVEILPSKIIVKNGAEKVVEKSVEREVVPA